MHNTVPSPNTPQTFYVTHEHSNHQLIELIISQGKQYARQLNNTSITGILSINFGKRLITLSDYTPLNQINKEAIIEIVDYDPIKNIFLIIGKKPPNIDTTIHWMIQQARNDINVLLTIPNQTQNKNSNPMTTIQLESTLPILDQLKTILPALKSTNSLNINDNKLLLIGHTSSDIQNQIQVVRQ